ncbi:MAG: Xaa-Pro peptidase family protein [Acidobacteriia bacterium]|nr:Xaa-Pro peptidase family protein [Terriglobia bacterium]
MSQRDDSNPLLSRQARLRARLEEKKLPFLLVSSPVNIFYLTGFRGSAGAAAFGAAGEASLWVDPRYTLQAREEARGVTIVEAKRGLLKTAGEWLAKRLPRVTGFEETHLTCAAAQDLKTQCPKISFKNAGGLIEELRCIKDEEEIEYIRQAARATAQALEDVRPLLRPGTRERDLAAEIEYRMRRRGAEGAAFETIVASGARGAWPHARASSKLLKKSELVILDLGAILCGYAADMTRTVHLGKPRARLRRLYAAVQDAQERALAVVREGVRAGDVDRAARGALGRHGLARYFTHSTGHGVGLEIHERPRLGRGETQRLEAGCVITVEPGVYLEGLGGIRIEDTVLVGSDGPEVLTTASKDDWIIL